jgi:hypothetical protein
MNFFIKIIFYNSCIFFCFVNKIVFYYQHHSFNRKQFFFPGKNSKKPGWFEKERKGNSIFSRKKILQNTFLWEALFCKQNSLW